MSVGKMLNFKNMTNLDKLELIIMATISLVFIMVVAFEKIW